MKYFLLIFLLINSNSWGLIKNLNFDLLEQYCFDCHSDGISKGDFDFDILLEEQNFTEESKEVWHKIWDVIEKKQMPPADRKKQPLEHDRENMMVEVEKHVFGIERHKMYAQYIPLHRLSNQQFANSLDEVVEFSFRLGHKMPLDATSAGFANNAKTMNLSPLLFERYQNVAFIVAFQLFNSKSTNPKALEKGQQWIDRFGDHVDAPKFRKALRELLLKAYRRPASKTEIEVLVKMVQNFYKQKLKTNEVLEELFKIILVSPEFLFRTELYGSQSTENQLLKLDDFALASRLSFFLWNSSPDLNLLTLARLGKLRESLDFEVERMVKDKRFENMVEAFGMYWLGVQYVENKKPDHKKYKIKSTYKTLMAMRKETSLFLKYMFQSNKKINELLTSKESFVNGRLGEFYGLDVKMSEASIRANQLGLPDPDAEKFTKVTFPETHHRSGILNMPSVMVATSNATSTSPVNRGMWVLETILGMPPPPAPEDVDPIQEEDTVDGVKLSFRELLEKHRADKRCASCHAMMDPLGFVYENINPVGKWRDKVKGEKIDSSTNWYGHEMKNFDDFKGLLLGSYRKQFIKTLTEHMLTYSLGRGLEIEDRIAIMKIASEMKNHDAKLQDLLKAIVKSTPFRYRLNGDNS